LPRDTRKTAGGIPFAACAVTRYTLLCGRRRLRCGLLLLWRIALRECLSRRGDGGRNQKSLRFHACTSGPGDLTYFVTIAFALQ
jgi:hypothetical protein